MFAAAAPWRIFDDEDFLDQPITLKAIFPDDLEEFDGNVPDGWTRHGKTWSITINPSAEIEADDEEAEPELQMQLVFAHTPTYPDEPPCIRLRSIKGLSDGDLQEATTDLQKHIEVSAGHVTGGVLLERAVQCWSCDRSRAA
eukprot:gene1513-1850_t